MSTGITDPQQHQSEHHLAQALFQLGNALKSAEGPIESHIDTLHSALAAFRGTPRFALLQELFQLSELECNALALVYIQAQDPDALSPFLGLSWYEQGPTISLDKILTLADPALNKRHVLASGVLHAPVFTWGLLRQHDSALTLHSPVFISYAAYQYLTSGTVDCASLRYFSLASISLDPVFDVGYGLSQGLLEPTGNKSVLVLKSDDSEMAAWYSSQWVFRQRGEYAVFKAQSDAAVNYTELEQELIAVLIAAKHKQRPVFLYWPNWLQFSQDAAKCSGQIVSAASVITHVEAQHRETSQNPLGVCHQEITPLTTKQLASAWLQLAPQEARDAQQQPNAQQHAMRVATLYPVSPWRMQHIATQAKHNAAQQEQVDFWQALQAQCLVQQSQGCDELATLCHSRFTLNDMLLNEKSMQHLRELVARVHYQSALQSRFKRLNPGCKALFWGKPGTGKSMAAEAIAGQLQLPLYVVNLANIASKWIGETEKQLAKLFDAAEQHNAVLMFDEADAIFAKRSEVESSHDKNANMGVSYLLQRVERYSGLLLLSTNFKANLDDAFLRRFHSVIEFTLPTEAERLKLWQRALQGQADDHLRVGINELAQHFDLSPAQINNVVENALLQTLMANQTNLSRAAIAKALQRELTKQHAGFIAQQSIDRWLTGKDHGSILIT